MFVFVIYNCSDPTSRAQPAILDSLENGEFHDVSMGDHLDLVKEKEGSQLVYAMPDELVYRLPKTGPDSVWYQVSYNFNEQGLYDINLDVYAKTNEALKSLSLDFLEHYTEKYGEGKAIKDQMKWRILNQAGRFVSITMRDSLVMAGVVGIRINFNESEN